MLLKENERIWLRLLYITQIADENLLGDRLISTVIHAKTFKQSHIFFSYSFLHCFLNKKQFQSLNSVKCTSLRREIQLNKVKIKLAKSLPCQNTPTWSCLKHLSWAEICRILISSLVCSERSKCLQSWLLAGPEAPLWLLCPVCEPES